MSSKKRSKTTTPEWSEFEDLIQRLNEQLAPTGVVRRNHKIQGRSGRRRELDVTIKQPVGPASILVVIECKKWRRPIGIEKVEAFVTKLRDVGGDKGIMISPSGFQEGAKCSARENNILLLKYREARASDWAALLGPDAWVTFIFRDVKKPRVNVTLANGETIIQVPPVASLLDAQNALYCTMHDLLDVVIDHALGGLKIGHRLLVSRIEEPELFLEGNEKCGRVVLVQLQGEFVVRRYLINLKLAGSVLEQVEQNSPIYTQLFSQGVDWRALVESQEGVLLSQTEYEQFQKQSGASTGFFKVDNLKKFIRIGITHKPRDIQGS